jgi:hypothetical protein
MLNGLGGSYGLTQDLGHLRQAQLSNKAQDKHILLIVCKLRK